jgi:hypothetical protein
MVAQVFNHTYSGGRDQSGGSWFKAILAKSSQDPISINNWMWWCMPLILATWGSTNRRIVVQARPGIK